MNAMLKAQRLATSLDLYFSSPGPGGNKISAPAPIGGLTIDLTNICKMIDSSNGTGAQTMLLIVYDEHGGFYDHAEPPVASTSLTAQGTGRLGPRVPAFVVSPWMPARTVLKDTFEHASIPATILRRFCSPHPPSMGPRVDAAPDLRGALSLQTPREHLLGPVMPTPRRQ